VIGQPPMNGIPMLYGLRPKARQYHLEYYGYPDHGTDALARNIDRETLCRHAVEKGFQTVLVLNDLDQPA
jgi:hypothetical protein